MEEKTDRIITQPEDKSLKSLSESIMGLGMCMMSEYVHHVNDKYRKEARKTYSVCSYCKKPCMLGEPLCSPCETQRYFGFLKKDVNFGISFYRKATLSEIKEFKLSS
jgi:hypothetical protein